MVRTKEYNRDEVINSATRLFWARGYQSTSVSDLVEATGLNKRSMYTEFGNKAGLFHECINRYAAMLDAEVLSILNRQPLGLTNIRAFFQNRIEHASSQNCNGCMIVNTAGEGAHIDPRTLGQVHSCLVGLREALLACLAAAQEAGEVDRSKDCRVCADLLLHFTAGIMVLSKTRPEEASLASMVEMVMSVLRG